MISRSEGRFNKDVHMPRTDLEARGQDGVVGGDGERKPRH